MKNKSTLSLGDSEMEVLTLVWELKKATVSQVQEKILQNRKVAYTTVMTMMQNLSKKGYLEFEKEGQMYVYTPAIDPTKVKKDFLGHMINKVFKGSPAALMQTLVQSEEISDEDQKSIMDIINKMG